MSRPLRSTMASAEMSQHQAGAGADHDRHAGDHREGGKQAAPDAEFAEEPKPLIRNLPMPNRNVICPLPRTHYPR